MKKGAECTEILRESGALENIFFAEGKTAKAIQCKILL